MFRTLLALFCCASAALAQNPSGDVAIGVFPFLVGNMDGRVNEIAANCQTHGIDTVYVSVFRTRGPSAGDLWISDDAGTWNPAFGPVRPGGAGIGLRALVNACHAASVRVVAVLKCFDSSVQPDNAAHRQYLLDVIGYLVDSFEANGLPVYDLDGIALDYVRYVGGAANPALVTGFLADVRQRIGGLSLHAYLIASRYTFDGPTYNSQFNSYASVIASLASQYGQHWEQMAPYVDVMMPMSYTADGSIYNTYAEHQAYVQRTAFYARTACQLAGFPTRRVCPTLRTYSDSAETTTTQTIDASIVGALLGGGDGYQAFRYQHLVNNPAWWGPMAQHAVAGCNWPVPVATASAQQLTVVLDATASHDVDQPGATLTVRFDHDGDGVFDTPWLANAPAQALSRHPGSWQSTVQVRDSNGHTSTTRRRYAATSPLSLWPIVVSATTGGTVSVNLDVGSAGAGDFYLALAGISGTTPGFTWMPGFPIALNIDFLTGSLAANPNGGLVANGLGVFDAAGRATVTATIPPRVAVPFAGSFVFWTFLAVDPLTGPSCVGDSKPLLILP